MSDINARSTIPLYWSKQMRMIIFSTVALVTLILNSINVVASNENYLGQCKVVGKVVCDENPLTPTGPSPLSRGKRGPKGEKGGVGSPGQKGESNKHVISKHAKMLEKFEKIIQQQSVLIEKQSELIEEKSIFLEKQSELIRINSALIDELSS